MKSYREVLNSPEWRQKRVAVILRSRGRCERCSRWPTVNVHHLSYDNLGNEPLSDLQGVCSKCHKELHQ